MIIVKNKIILFEKHTVPGRVQCHKINELVCEKGKILSFNQILCLDRVEGVFPDGGFCEPGLGW